MPSQDQVHYFRARAAEERQRASEATDPNVRQLHLEMAERYELASESDSHLEQARDAINRSFDLLAKTSRLASD